MTDEYSFILVRDRPTDKAILVRDADDSEYWLPRSEIEYDENAKEGKVLTVTMPQWLAEEKGVI